ncbi:hypothetical protein HK100_003438 [Physocladia obscura]|uniref:Uncharacterized protein n=1 Tax=Physocladia obscura TaxID=109957 RepID=A0AAD5XJS5_9FUNG|nr:hypothetical protein HK100_003438 [Physocladia obscura]
MAPTTDSGESVEIVEHMLASELREWLRQRGIGSAAELALKPRTELLALARATNSNSNNAMLNFNLSDVTPGNTNPLAPPSRFPYDRFAEEIEEIDESPVNNTGNTTRSKVRIIAPSVTAALVDAFVRLSQPPEPPSAPQSPIVDASQLTNANTNTISPPSPTPLIKKGKAPMTTPVDPSVAVLPPVRVSSQRALLPQVLQQNLEAAEIGDPDSMFAIGKAFIEGTGGLEKHVGLALTWLQMAAAKNNTDAMVLLGKLYSEGIVAKWEARKKIPRGGISDAEKFQHDKSLAADWFLLAAHLGDFEGMVKIGKCYETGSGVPLNPNLAFKYYYLAGIHGYSRGSNLVGWCYHKGFGVKVDTVEACKWYRKAAESGLSDGQANLGHAYSAGWCNGYVDLVEAAHWLWAAAVVGHDAKSAFELGALIERGKALKQDIFKAFGWYYCAAEGGYAIAMEKVARLLLEGNGCNQDKVAAIKWYERAISAGSVTSLVNLGLIFEHGNSVQKDYEKAISLYRSAAEKGDTRGKYHFAYCFETGHGVVRNISLAFQQYESIAKAHSPQTPVPPVCFFRLAQCYQYGKGTAQDLQKAYKYYFESYKEYMPSCVALANMIRTGIKDIVDKDTDKALQLYEYAAEKGNSKALYYLGFVFVQKSTAASPTNPEKSEEYQAAGLKYLKFSANANYPPALYRLGVVLLNDSKSGADLIEEGVYAIKEAAKMNEPDAMELLSKLYSRGVDIDANGSLVKSVSGSKINLFGGGNRNSTTEPGARFSLTKPKPLPTPPTEYAGGAVLGSNASVNGSIASNIPGQPYTLLPKDLVASAKWKNDASAVRKEKENVEALIAKAAKRKTPIPDSLVDAIERLRI